MGFNGSLKRGLNAEAFALLLATHIAYVVVLTNHFHNLFGDFHLDLSVSVSDWFSAFLVVASDKIEALHLSRNLKSFVIVAFLCYVIIRKRRTYAKDRIRTCSCYDYPKKRC